MSNSIIFRTSLTPLYVAQFLIISSSNVSTPILSLFALSLGASVAMAGMVVASNNVVPLIGQIPVGIAGDKFGRHAFLYAASVFAILGPLLSFLAPDVTTLIATRLVAGFATAAFMPLSFAIVAERAAPGSYGRSMGNLGASIQLGIFLGPLLGAFAAQTYGYRNSFLLAVLLGVLTLVMTHYTVRHLRRTDARPRERRASPSSGSAWMRERNFLGGLLGPLVAIAGGGAFTALIPIYLVDVVRSATISEVGIVLATGAVGQVMVRMTMSSLSDRVGRKKVLVSGLGINGLAFVILVFRADLPSMILIAVLNGIGTALVNPAGAALVADSVPSDRRGMAMGIYETAISVGSVAGTAGLGYIAEASGFTAAFDGTALLQFVAAAGMMALVVNRGFRVHEQSVAPEEGESGGSATLSG